MIRDKLSPNTKMDKYNGKLNHENLFVFLTEFETVTANASDEYKIRNLHMWIQGPPEFKSEIRSRGQTEANYKGQWKKFRKQVLSTAIGGVNPYEQYSSILVHYPSRKDNAHGNVQPLLRSMIELWNTINQFATKQGDKWSEQRLVNLYLTKLESTIAQGFREKMLLKTQGTWNISKLQEVIRIHEETNVKIKENPKIATHFPESILENKTHIPECAPKIRRCGFCRSKLNTHMKHHQCKFKTQQLKACAGYDCLQSFKWPEKTKEYFEHCKVCQFLKCSICHGKHSTAWCPQAICGICNETGHHTYNHAYVERKEHSHLLNPHGKLKGGSARHKEKRTQLSENMQDIVVYAETYEKMKRHQFKIFVAQNN